MSRLGAPPPSTLPIPSSNRHVPGGALALGPASTAGRPVVFSPGTLGVALVAERAGAGHVRFVAGVPRWIAGVPPRFPEVR